MEHPAVKLRLESLRRVYLTHDSVSYRMAIKAQCEKVWLAWLLNLRTFVRHWRHERRADTWSCTGALWKHHYGNQHIRLKLISPVTGEKWTQYYTLKESKAIILADTSNCGLKKLMSKRRWVRAWQTHSGAQDNLEPITTQNKTVSDAIICVCTSELQPA